MTMSKMIGSIYRKGAAAGCSNWTCRKVSSGWISPKSTAGSVNNISGAAAGSLNNILFGGCGASCVTDDSLNYQSSLGSKMTPWLMLPPSFEGGNMVYNLYSLGDSKVVSLNKRSGEEKEDLPDDDAMIVGSSHGWLALLNKRNSDLFLSNPITRRHVKLPPINTLPINEVNLTGGFGITNLIISSSPDEEDCRAMLIYAPADQLAFCCPGRSTEWTTISAPIHKKGKIDNSYESIVYSTRQNLFFCYSRSNGYVSWDLRDPKSPRFIPLVVKEEKLDYSSMEEWEIELEWQHTPIIFLVVAQHSDELFLVHRSVLDRIGPDGCYVEDNSRRFPYKTVGFDVYKYNPEEKTFKDMDSSLDGLALFIGFNHGFALSATDYPGLNPNSIYFTDHPDLIISCYNSDDGINYGGHDIGIFNYENKTFSPCYYPCDVKSIRKILPPPVWFTPTQPLFN